MNIEAGEYVRTKNGYITKIVDCLGKDNIMHMKHYEIDSYLPQNGFILYDNNVKAHSKNIMDLIEVRRLCEWTKNNPNNQRPIYKRPDRFMD